MSHTDICRYINHEWICAESCPEARAELKDERAKLLRDLGPCAYCMSSLDIARARVHELEREVERAYKEVAEIWKQAGRDESKRALEVLQATLAERDERVRELEAVREAAQYYFEANDDGHECGDGRSECIPCCLKDALAASAPAGEKTSEGSGTINRQLQPGASQDGGVSYATSPPAEAPRESGVPSGNDEGPGITIAIVTGPEEPGALRGEVHCECGDILENAAKYETHRKLSHPEDDGRAALRARLAQLEALLGEALDEEWWPDDSWMSRVSRALAEDGGV